ncbi:GyrI-like domain-containing protein [Priestia koreensis]|uniref:GyrI-like domain-containing protein n=1 Tax=Priestia koreensis TaxID=284581 RepID=UPI003D073CD9
MSWVDSLQKAITYIENHLLNPIKVQDISQNVQLPSSHLQRIFLMLGDISIEEYIRLRRLSLATIELKAGKEVKDIYEKYTYNHENEFINDFYQHYGITPQEMKISGTDLPPFHRFVVNVTVEGKEPQPFLEKPSLLQYEIREQDAIEIVGFKERFPLSKNYYHNGIQEMWKSLKLSGNQVLKDSLEIIGIYEPTDKESDTVDYWIGSATIKKVNEEYSHMLIPASQWAVFIVEDTSVNTIQRTWKRIFNEWFPTSGFGHTGLPEMEIFQLDDLLERKQLEIWIPVKKISSY